MDLPTVFEKVGLALGLGLLVGLQRERAESWLAGIRTFPLITVFGTITALLGHAFGGSAWVVGLGALALAALVVAGNVAKMRAGLVDPGVTTEVAVLLMYGVGAYLVVGHAPVAIAIGGGTALLLHWKEPLHHFVARIGPADIKAVMQFVLITLVILPVLPDQAYGPYGVLNPHRIWLMVVLIVGLSLGGYLAYKFYGQETGILLAGLLGGMISSTATTISAARRTIDVPGTVGLAAVVVMAASAISSARVIVELAVVAPGQFWLIASPMMVMLGWKSALAGLTYLRAAKEKVEMPEQANPAELKSALVFGGIYAVVLLAVAAARDHLGSAGLYAVALLSGLTDMDAITLSTGQLVEDQQLEVGIGWRVILLASLSNLLFKGSAVVLLGHRDLTKKIAIIFGTTAAVGILLLFFWPLG
jgi:uncharacterized membrane protein (DUF4010 family)